MNVFILSQTNREAKALEATSVSVYSTKDLAVAAYEKSIEDYNGDMDPTDEYWVHPLVTADELREDGIVLILNESVVWTLTEYTIDSGEIVGN